MSDDYGFQVGDMVTVKKTGLPIKYRKYIDQIGIIVTIGVSSKTGRSLSNIFWQEFGFYNKIYTKRLKKAKGFKR